VVVIVVPMIIVVMIVMVIVAAVVVVMDFVAMFLDVTMFFHAFVAEALGGAFTFAALVEFVPFFMARSFEMPDGVRVNIGPAIHPSPAPADVVDENSAVLPYDAIGSPSPGPEHWP